MDSLTYDISDKENATPSTTSPPPTWSPRHRPMYSPGGAHISKPPRRPTATLRSILADSPSRCSYQHQMTNHWASTPKGDRTRSASPRRTPELEAGGTTYQQSHASMLSDSQFRSAIQSDKRRKPSNPAGAEDGADKNATPTSSPNSSDSATSGCKGGVPIQSPSPATRAAKPLPLRAKNSIQIGYSNPDSALRSTRIAVPETGADASSTSSTPGGGAALPASETYNHDPLTPMNDLEAAVARCFNDHSPLASREERRKTLHTVNGGVQISSPQSRSGQRQQDPQQLSPGRPLLHQTPRAPPSSPSSSSSAAWTGDEVFLPPRLTAESKITSPCRFRIREQQKQHVSPPPAAVKHQPAPLRCPAGSTCSRSPLSLPTRQRADSAVQFVGMRVKSRFEGVAIKKGEAQADCPAADIGFFVGTETDVGGADPVRGIPKRHASDADDEDEGSGEESSGTSPASSSC